MENKFKSNINFSLDQNYNKDLTTDKHFNGFEDHEPNEENNYKMSNQDISINDNINFNNIYFRNEDNQSNVLTKTNYRSRSIISCKSRT